MKFQKMFNLKKRHRREPRVNAFVLESLEPRLLLSATPMTAAVVTTDHLDYAPGETAVITTSIHTGEGPHFTTGELVRFQVTRTDGMADYVGSTADMAPAGNEAWYVTDGVGGFAAHQEFDINGQAIDRDANGVADWIAPDNDLTVNGSISTTWYVEEQYRNSSLLVTAAGQESGAVATQSFTDAVGANNAPSGADQTITITENTPYAFNVADLGFTDPNDTPANGFQAVTITALPVDGTLTLHGTPVQAGDSITLPTVGVSWTAHASSQGWHAVASSADGSKLVAAALGGQLYTSTDGGVTWAAHESNRQWVSVASSADGTKLVAAALNWGTSGDQLYTSTDAGVTWTARANNQQWRSVASSEDGMRLVAAAHGGQLYTSTDAGVTWTARESTRLWESIASSADGTMLVAGVWNGQLYTSTDAGVTWAARESTRLWNAITSSADGTQLAAGAYNGQLYTSMDAGVTWTARENSRVWYSLTSSTDGTRLAAAADGGQLYTSTDAGMTWTAHESSQRWLSIASSADGTKLVAGAYGGQLYTSVPQPLGLVYTPAANANGNSLASITFQVQDSGGTANGGVNLDQTPNTIAFNVTPVHHVINNAPSGTDQTITINENEPYTFSVADFGFTDPNDTPANGFQAVTITALPVDGTLTLHGTPVQAGESITLPPAGETWTARASSQGWDAIASSADGTMLVAAVWNGQLYTSSDAGVTWTARENMRGWHSVASSSDGMQLVAAVWNGQLYTSSDAGVTWTARESTRPWVSVASSADGKQLVAATHGQLYTSTNAGVTWTARESNRLWQSVASSADGSKLVAASWNGQLYTSTDAGVTWTARESNRQWRSVASSTDGIHLVAAADGGQLYTSTDAGVTWTARESTRRWYAVASSAGGTKLVAADAAGYTTGRLYSSTDAGVTWTARESNRQWLAVASSADGTKLVAGAYGGQLYTSVAQLDLVYTPKVNAHGTSLASVVFQVQDSGRTANGGVNLDQTPNTITFNVTPVHVTVTTTVTSSAATSTYGDHVTFTATVTPANGTSRPVGSVEFFDGQTSLGSITNASNGTGLDEIFTLSVSNLATGAHAIHAVYTATDASVHNTSGNIMQTVNKANAAVIGYSGIYDAAAHGPTAVGVFGESLSGLVLSVPTHTDAGIYLDRFTFTDLTGNYNNVVNGSVIYTIDKAEATITVNGYSGTYDGAAHGAMGTVVGALDDLSAVGSSLDLGSSFTNAPGGTAYWTFHGGNNYHDQHGSVAIVIAKADATITVTGYNGVYDGGADRATGTARGVLGESLNGLDLSGTSHTDAGSYSDSWPFTDGTGNYNDASGTVITSIDRANATITVDGYSGVYDGAAHGARGTVIGVDAVGAALGSSLDLGLSFINAGSGTAIWTFNGGNNYHDQHGSVVIGINAKTISYTIGNASHVFGNTANLATDLGTAFLTGVNGETLAIVYSSAGNTVASLVGSYAINGSVSNGTGMLSNYHVIINPGTLTVTTPRVVTIVQDGVNLIIVGTGSCDSITVDATNQNSITVNGGARFSVGVGGRVIVYGMAGSDNISLIGNINLEAHGGDGNDTITGGAGNDVIFGDLGNDTLTGSAGNDVLVGGSGSDRLVGSAGHDLLISGELIGDHNGGAYDYAALRAIDDSWAANWSVDADLESTSGDVLDESGSADQLTGSSGHDWFILGSTDKITDIKSTTKDGDKITY